MTSDNRLASERFPVVGRRRTDAELDNLIVSLPVEYTKKPLLRG